MSEMWNWKQEAFACHELRAMSPRNDKPATTLPETNGSPLKIGLPNRKGSYSNHQNFRCYVSFRVPDKSLNLKHPTCNPEILESEAPNHWNMSLGSSHVTLRKTNRNIAAKKKNRPKLLQKENSIVFQPSMASGATVDGSEIPNNHLGWCWNPVNSGMNYQPQLVQDFFHQQYVSFRVPGNLQPFVGAFHLHHLSLVTANLGTHFVGFFPEEKWYARWKTWKVWQQNFRLVNYIVGKKIQTLERKQQQQINYAASSCWKQHHFGKRAPAP